MLAEERNWTASRSRSLKSNDPMLLDDPGLIWQVQSGSLALFAIQLQQGLPKGQRRYLFSIKAGEAMFSGYPLAAQSDHSELDHGNENASWAGTCILAVALENTQLVALTRSTYCDRLIESPQSTVAQLEAWVHRLGSALSGIASPILPTPITTCGVLASGEVFQPPQGQVVWVQVWQGQAELLGWSGLTVTSDQGHIPLQSHLWLRAEAIVELDLRGHRSLTQAAALLRGLDQLQTLVFRGIEQLQQQEYQRELSRFQARGQLNRRAVTQTLDDLAGLFQVKPRPDPTSEAAGTPESALLIAAGAVGRSLGVTICPPAASEDLRRVRDPLEGIARASQIRIRRVTLREGWWQQDSGALLAYALADNRPIALLPLGDTAYEWIDPLHNQRGRCDPAFATTLANTAYTFYRPLPADLKPLKLMQFALRGHWQELLIVVLTGIAATLLGMITPQATAVLIDQAIPDADRRLLLQIGAGLVATTIGVTLFQVTQGIALMRLESFADASTQAAVWDRLLNLKATFFRQYSTGDLSSRVSAITQIRQKLGNTLLKTVFASLFSFLNLGLLFYYSLPLALVATAVALINIAVTVVAGLLTLKKVRPLLDRQGKLLGTMVEIINGISKFRIAGAETRAFAYWGKQYSTQLKLTLSSQNIEDNLAVINKLLAALTPAVLFAFATHLLQQSQAEGGSFSTGTFLAFNTAFGTFIAGATSLSTTAIDVMDILPIWQRVQPILQARPEVDLNKADPGRISGQVTIDRAVFRYRADGALTLDEVSLQAEPGEFIALVGPSGSGKSTLLRLILGFDVPESGTVCFDGQDLAGLDVNAVRRQMGVVLQNSRLMAGSIFENISSSALITMDEAWEAAQLAGLADDIRAMPMGMHTVVSEGGSNLSGGQRQRLLIARALALRPRILLFDEATSALDNRTQAIVSASLDRLKVTRIVVAHRLSTIRNADRIYVLQNGRLIQQGSFEQLAGQEGLFSQLIRRQQL